MPTPSASRGDILCPPHPHPTPHAWTNTERRPVDRPCAKDLSAAKVSPIVAPPRQPLDGPRATPLDSPTLTPFYNPSINPAATPRHTRLLAPFTSPYLHTIPPLAQALLRTTSPAPAASSSDIPCPPRPYHALHSWIEPCGDQSTDPSQTRSQLPASAPTPSFSTTRDRYPSTAPPSSHSSSLRATPPRPLDTPAC